MIDSLGIRALVGLSLLVTSACSAMRNCPSGQDEPIVIDTGLTDTEKGTFQSAKTDGPLDAFPAKTKLRFKHELGFIPLNFKAWLSFDAGGTHGKDGGSIAESAGNQALFDCVDAHIIEVKNDTCEDGFFIRITASDEAPVDPKDPEHGKDACGE